MIIGNNVLAHVPDINSFVEGLRLLPAQEGVITIEVPHLLNLMQHNQFDTIYHEHFFYFSLTALQKIFAAHSLKIYDVEELPTHGGSLRIYATHADGPAKIANRVEEIVKRELEYGLSQLDTYLDFRKKVEKIKRDSVQLLSQLKEQGKKIAACGAAAKGNTFLNYCGIGRETIDYVADSIPAKQGLYLPGTLIPIVDKAYLLEQKPDYVLILPWNVRREIADWLGEVRDWGCKFITLIPEIDIF